MVKIFGLLTPLLLPGTFLLLIWFLYLAVVKKDQPASIILILAIIIIVDCYMSIGLFLPGFKKGSIRYSEFLILIYFISNKKNRLGTTAFIDKITIYLLIFVFFFLVAVFRSADPFRNFFYGFRQQSLTPFVLFLIASWGYSSIEDYKRFCLYLFCLGIFISIGSYQMMFFDWIYIRSPNEDTFYHAVNHNRFGSYFGNPNRLGAFYALILPSVMVMILYEKKVFNKILYVIGTLAIVFAFIKTYSRGSYLGLGAAMTIFMFFRIKNFSFGRKFGILCLILILVTVISPNIHKSIFQRLLSIETEEAALSSTLDMSQELEEEALMSSRPFLWKNALKVIAAAPIMGIGWGLPNYAKAIKRLEYNNQVTSTEARALITIEHPHNTYLYISVFLGNLALIAFLLFLYNFFKSALAFFRECEVYELRLINFGFISGIVGYLVAITFDYQLFEKNSASPFWILTGFSLSLLTFVKNNKNKDEEGI